MVAASVATGASEVEIGACQKLSCDIYQGLTNEGNVSKVLTVMFKVESINLGFEFTERNSHSRGISCVTVSMF